MIAALLVSAVLITTVITTYSMIRDSLNRDQPEALNAVDEINFAIKQILGFTVGYYGSVLKVTGNATDAYNRTLSYVYSGLKHLADLHPEWGTSISLIPPLEANAYWYTNESYSSGRMLVNYNLTKLGIRGIIYEPTCRLDVQVVNGSPSGKVCLNVTKDESESLINLRKQNFKFYQFTANSAWELVNPNTEPSFENGAYYIDAPSGIDEKSFAVQVEDSRGIIAIASSFNRYTITPTWNSTLGPTEHYVDNDTSNVDGYTNKGTHSSFTAQQTQPDGSYDTLTEENTALQQYYPSSYSMLGSTSIVNGSLNDLSSNNSAYMTFRSYVSQNSTASFGNYTQLASSATIENTILGSVFTAPYDCWVDSVTAYIGITNTAKNSSAMVYANSSLALVGTSDYQVLSVATSWRTFTFTNKPHLTAGVAYILATWCASGGGNGLVYYATGSTNNGVSDSDTFDSTPANPLVPTRNTNRHSIYANITYPSEYTSEVEFAGTSNTENWTWLNWTVDSSLTQNSVTATFQLYNYQTGQYSTSGNGYMTETIGVTDVTKTQNITTNPTDFRNSTGNWKMKIKCIKTTNSEFDWKADLVKYETKSSDNYVLDIEEQFTNVNYNRDNEELCIKTGNFSDLESIMVDVWNGSAWINIIASLTPNNWNNVSVTSHLTSPTFTIRFRDNTQTSDGTRSYWQIDAALLHLWPAEDLYSMSKDVTIVVELLQNGTIRWLGQDLLTQTKPIPPLPVKAIHVNQTIEGLDQQTPFQIEDWASEYRIPLGLTSNASLFNSRTMLVFQASPNVSKITIWWNGSDKAVQTPYSMYNLNTSPFKNDDPDNGFLSNGLLNLSITRPTVGYNQVLRVISKTGNMNSTAEFTRINNEPSTYGSAPSYVIHHGIVRDVVQTEPEWRGGAGGSDTSCTCPDLYAHIVITLPANATFFTYTSRIVFLNSTQTMRKLSDLSILSLDATGLPQASRYPLTENGTQISNNTGIFYNYTGFEWAHHWSQIANSTIPNTIKGTGIMFTNYTNLQMYYFDNETSKTGGLNVTSTDKIIELAPVKRYETQDFHAQQLDITWHCAIATFDATTPVYTDKNGSGIGLWLTVVHPPTITVTTEN
jgi:hypothetical protein